MSSGAQRRVGHGVKTQVLGAYGSLARVMIGQASRFFGVITGLVLGLFAADARADVDVGRLVTLSGAKLPNLSGFSRRDDGKMRLLVSGPSLGDARAEGLVPLRSGLYAMTADATEVRAFVEAHPDHRVSWAPPRKTLLDRAAASVRADVAHESYGLTGKGVVVGIVDTGVDVTHPDLRNADGTSRIAWLLDLSQSPTGNHSDLEDEYGCNTSSAACAVFSGADIDALIANDVAGDEPRDTYGHGTHVASLAAGNGLSTTPATYVGMAPEASLVVVRATRDDEGSVQDADIVLATKFIFDQADQMGLPAVVNLSLGGDFGAHDGTSMLERELSAFVGDAYPGHSIVVAGGNSGMLYARPDGSTVAEPLGIHATMQVLEGSRVQIPVLVGESAIPTTDSQVFMWVASRPGDNLLVGLEAGDNTLIAPIGIGDSAEIERSGYTIAIENGITESDQPETVDHYGAYVYISGPFVSEEHFQVTFEGHGTASIWLQPIGGIDPAYNGFGALIPGAQREGTITVPASSPGLIAVGASLDRTSWVDVNGVTESIIPELVRYGMEGEIVPFSAAGPNALDQLKPDIVAPGAYIVGAMSNVTDPRTSTGEYGMFSGGDMCDTGQDNCLVVDDYHAISMGTSMASPVVAGAVALLLQQQPGLTQTELRRYLQAGARNPLSLYATTTQTGAGLLDIEGAILALSDQSLGTEATNGASYLTLGAAFIRPDPDWPVAGMLHLRDLDGQAVDVDVDRLSLQVTRGTVSSPLTREAPGYYTFALSGANDTGGQELVVDLKLDNQSFLRETRTIATDAPSVRRYAVVAGGCAVLNARGERAGLVSGLLLLGLFGLRLRRAIRRG